MQDIVFCLQLYQIMSYLYFLQINIAALRIAADKFDPDFIEKRKAALEVSRCIVKFLTFNSQVIFCLETSIFSHDLMNSFTVSEISLKMCSSSAVINGSHIH